MLSDLAAANIMYALWGLGARTQITYVGNPAIKTCFVGQISMFGSFVPQGKGPTWEDAFAELQKTYPALIMPNISKSSIWIATSKPPRTLNGIVKIEVSFTDGNREIIQDFELRSQNDFDNFGVQVAQRKADLAALYAASDSFIPGDI